VQANGLGNVSSYDISALLQSRCERNLAACPLSASGQLLVEESLCENGFFVDFTRHETLEAERTSFPSRMD
jgi:hypothetical protein